MINGSVGFIGSHVVSRFLKTYSDYQVVNFNKLTYAGNLANAKHVENLENYGVCETR